MNTKQYAEIIKSALNYKDYANLVNALGTSLNDRKDRFDKSDIIEQSIDIYSNGRFDWVDDIGRDHSDTELNLDLEFKYIADGLLTKKKAPKKVIKVKLKNSLGANKGTTIVNPADYYMIGQQDAIAIISWEEIKSFLVGVPDGIEAHIPFESLSFVFGPEDVSIDDNITINYKSEKLLAQKRIIKKVMYRG